LTPETHHGRICTGNTGRDSPPRLTWPAAAQCMRQTHRSSGKDDAGHARLSFCSDTYAGPFRCTSAVRPRATHSR